jgi:hypothetical protein
MTTPQSEEKLTALTDPANVRFTVIPEDEVADTGGFTDAEIELLLNSPAPTGE